MSDATAKYGLLAEFDTPADLMQAAEKVRDAGYRRWDVYTPFPVHGMDAAMGLKNSQVGWFSFCGGVTGVTLGYLMIWWMNAYDYSIIVGGKPLFSPIYSFPVAYECTILLASFGSLGGMLFLNRLPRWYHPLFSSDRFKKVTHDKFFLAIEATDPKFSETETRKLLTDVGSKHIEEVRIEMRYLLLIFGVTVIAVMVVAGKRGDMTRRPPIELFPDMDRQPKLRPQEANSFFKDGLSSQQPVAGAIARGSAWQDSPENTGRIPGTTNFVATIPVPVTQQLLARGQQRFNINCSPCHGLQGDGKGITTKFGMAVIADLHDGATRKVPQQSDGELFNTISNGKGLMQGYAANVTIPDRWAIIAYVRALQRSHLGTMDDVPAAERANVIKK